MISYIYQCPTGPGGNYLGGMPLSFASSHRFVFRGICDNKCKPFYSFLFSPSCLINIGFVVNLLLPAHRPHCNQQAFVIGPYKWHSGFLGSLWLCCDRHPPALGSRVIHNMPQKLLDLLSGPGRQPLLFPCPKQYGRCQWLLYPGDFHNQGGHFLSISQDTSEWTLFVPEQMRRPPLPSLFDAQ